MICITRHFYIVFFFIIYNSFCFSQETKKVLSSGRSITRDLSPEAAKNKAIEDAKQNALRKAGLSESIYVASLLYSRQTNKEVFQRFDEISSSEINGAIIVDTILGEKRSWDENNNMIIDVEIASTIFKYYDKIDPAFAFKVEGLKENYCESERILFSFTPTMSGFLKIFTISDNETHLLYPFKSQIAKYLDDKEDSLFLKNKTLNFPIHPAYKHGFSVKINSDLETENILLIFLFLKKNIPFQEKILNSKTVFRWIFEIPLDQRVVEYKSITLTKK
jgi:hypothetical protein